MYSLATDIVYSAVANDRYLMDKTMRTVLSLPFISNGFDGVPVFYDKSPLSSHLHSTNYLVSFWSTIPN